MSRWLLSAILSAFVPQFAAAQPPTGFVVTSAIQRIPELSNQFKAANNLKAIALGTQSYEKAHHHFPPAALVDRKGKKLLSWRVQILPFIGQDELYTQFKLDEPWDSVHNKKLVREMPKVYADPRAPAEPGETYYKAFVGEAAGLDWVKARQLTEIKDGTANTFLAAAAGEPVIWTKPDDFEFDPKGKLPDLNKPFAQTLVVLFNGRVRTLSPTASEKALKASIGRDEGEVVDFNRLYR